MASFMSDGSPNRYPLQNGYDTVAVAMQEGAEDAVRPVVKDRRTKLILKTVFSELCPTCGKYLKQVEREVARLKDANPLDADLVRKVSHLILEFLTETNQLAVNIESFTEQKWNLHGGNMHSEFSKVAYETFRGDTNWGRILMFFGFAVSFSVYLEEGGVVGAADSVLEWTCQVVEEDLGAFYTSHQGWEGFGDYLETALKATRRSHLKQRNIVADSGDETVAAEETSASLWQGAFAAGAVAVGAMAALTLRQAFS